MFFSHSFLVYCTLSNVVIARVAILRLTSVIRFSRSKLQVVTDIGCTMATLLSVRTAANLRVGRGELRNSWRTVIIQITYIVYWTKITNKNLIQVHLYHFRVKNHCSMSSIGSLQLGVTFNSYLK